MLRTSYTIAAVLISIFALLVLGYTFVVQATEMPVAYISYSEGVCKRAQVKDAYISCDELKAKYKAYETIYIK